MKIFERLRESMRRLRGARATRVRHSIMGSWRPDSIEWNREITPEERERALARYDEHYPSLRNWHDDVKQNLARKK